MAGTGLKGWWRRQRARLRLRARAGASDGRLARLAAGGRRLRNQLHARLAGLDRRVAVIARPPEPRGLGRPERGRMIVSGQVRLGGHLAQLRPGRSLFSLGDAPAAFVAEAHAFAWLDDLAALDGAVPQRVAQAWLFDWLHRYGRGAGPGWEPALTAERLRRWLNHAPFLLHGRDPADRALFHRVLARQMRFLGRRWTAAAPGLPRFQALAGLIAGGLALNGMEAQARAALPALGGECAARIDPGGAIASRNPEELAEIFALLAACREALARLQAGTTAGAASLPLEAALARIAPVLRALRHGDGSLARFHGGGRGAEGRLERALATAGVRPGQTPELAMGFLRVTHGRSSLIVDVGAPPIGPGSGRAHASTLAFELTSGRRPLIVTCGPGRAFGPDWARAGRVTAGHATLEIVGLSSARFGRGAPSEELLVEGPRQLRLSRSSDAEGTEITAAHDGYGRSHGLIHSRRLEFHAGGRVLSGEDTLAAETAVQRRRLDGVLREAPDGLPLALRFHLHPEVEARLEGAMVRLSLRSGEEWLFRHDGMAQLDLAESVWLDPDLARPLATRQVVLSARAIDYATRIRWSLAKADEVPLAIRDLQPAAGPG